MKKIFTYIRISLKDTLAYRGDMALYTASGIVFPMTSLIVWLNAGTPSPQFFIQYYILLLFVGMVCSNWESYFISRDIRLGNISPYLIKPVPYFLHQIGNNIGEKIMKGIFLSPALIILGLIFHFTFPVADILVWGAFFFSLIVAVLVGFVVDFMLGISAFWLDDANVLREIYNIAYLIFSGRFVPLIILPVFYRNLSNLLPFRYSLSLPLEIITGQITVDQILPSIAIQLLVLLIVSMFCRFLWQKGVVRYSASGG